MAIIFNADEIYQIAEDIEQNGHKFYSESAQKVRSPAAAKVLRNLAAMELQHLETFRSLHARLADQAKEELTFDPDGETGVYLQAAADSHIFKKYVDPMSLLKDSSNPREILELALRFEKDSVVFFLALSDMVPERLGKSEVFSLAKQEQSHIAIIQRALSKL